MESKGRLQKKRREGRKSHRYHIRRDFRPHVKWAKPYAGGAIKALVMAPVTAQRETVELAQRLSLDYTAWMSETFKEMNAPAAADPAFAFFQPPPAVVHRHLRECAAGDYDVIIVGKLDWAMLPGEQRLQLLEKVSAGTGLVYVGPPAGNKELEIVFGGKAAPEGFAFVAQAVPISSLPAFKGRSSADIIKPSMFGKGRVVVLNYGEIKCEMESGCLTPRWTEPSGTNSAGGGYSDEYHKPTGYVPPDDCPEMEFVPYEYYQSLVARAVLWASRKETPARLMAVTLPALLDYPATKHTAQVTTLAAPAGAALRASIRNRYDYGQVIELPAQPAGGESKLALPALSAGEYFLDVWLVSAEGKTSDWASARFAVQADLAIQRISLTGKSYAPGAEVAGQISLSRALSAGETLIAELWDNHERKLAEKPLAGPGAEIAFSFVTAQPLTIMHSIRARVTRQGEDVCTGRLNFPVRANLKRREGFNEVVWGGGGNTFLSNVMLRKLAQQDQADAIDIGFAGATHVRNIASADLTALPYTTGFGHFSTKVVPVTGTMGGCMTHPDTLKAVDKWFIMESDIYGPYGPLAWTHGDESFYASNPDTCWSETCLAAFREYLQKVYPDLAALSRVWGTKYADWPDVMPLTYDEAKATGNYAPWLEHRIAASLAWARLYARTGQALSVNDPGARAGFDGPQSLANPNGGINWWVLKDHVGILQDYQYNSESMEIFRSFAGPQHLTGMWYGTYGLTWQVGPNTVPMHHGFPWYSLFHGLNSTWFWVMGAPGSIGGYAPDMTSLPFFDASRQSLKAIRAGVLTLFRTGRRANDGIAIHYSDISRIADSLYTEDKLCNGWMESLADFNHAIEDCGLQYEYVAYEEIEQDELRKGNYRVLLMPHSRAVSEKEATAIRQFVRDGGLLVADIMPGVLDGHGAQQEPGMLADLFPKTDPGAANVIGKGKTVLLGDKLAGCGNAAYRNMQGWKKLEGRWQIMASLLRDQADVVPTVSVTHRNEGEMPPTEITRFVAGNTEFVGLLRKYYYYDNAAYPVTVRFARKSHVYDVRAGKYLGYVDRVDTDLSYEAQVYASLPYQVKAITLAAPRRADRTAPTALKLALKTAGGKPGAGHVFHVRVLSPEGTELSWYARQVAAVGGSATVGIPWALNDPAGRYTVVVRDVGSGVAARQEVSLR